MNFSSGVRLATFLINFECLSCGIFEVLEEPQEVESTDTNTFAAYERLGYIINKLVSPNFMVMMIQ